MRSLEPTESQVQAAVIGHWRVFGVPGSLVAAIPNARAHGQPGLTEGLYDLICVAPGFGCGFLELKTQRGRTSQAQMDFGAVLRGAGVPNAIAWGRDEPIDVLRRWGVVR